MTARQYLAPDVNGIDHNLEKYCALQNFTILCLMAISSTVVLCKTGFKSLEKWCLIAIFGFILSAVFRSMQSYVIIFHQDRYTFTGEEDVFLEFAIIMVWTVMYYVIFKI